MLIEVRNAIAAWLRGKTTLNEQKLLVLSVKVRDWGGGGVYLWRVPSCGDGLCVGVSASGRAEHGSARIHGEGAI